MQADPLVLFQQWLHDAESSEPHAPNAMTLATADASGRVSSRMVLLKGVHEGNFLFYTNLESLKARQIHENPHVSLSFHWKSLRKQVRIEGQATLVEPSIADAYFATRPRESQIGAWASKQSQVLISLEEFTKRLQHFEKEFKGRDVPRPSFWSGFSVSPDQMEFWVEKPFRLHERRVYMKQNTQTWKMNRLYP